MEVGGIEARSTGNSSLPEVVVAEPSKKTTSTSCELDSADTVAHGTNAGLAIWAADKRCHGTILEKAPVKCEQDVATSIQELIDMGLGIGGMVGSCGAVKLENYKCGLASDALVAATAGLAAAGGAIADKCAHQAHGYGDILDTATTLGKCTADAASSMNSFFEAHNSIQHLKSTCGSGKAGCTVSALDVTAVLADFGAYIAAAYDDCQTYHGEKNPGEVKDTEDADCADAVLDGVSQVSRLAELGLKMYGACRPAPSRLYLEGNGQATGSPLVLALAAIIPVAAVVSFVAGSRFAKSRQQTWSTDAELLESGSE